MAQKNRNFLIVMAKNYKRVKRGWVMLLAVLALVLGGPAARAQSGPVGNEWIVPGQQYYKMKIVRDGLYKIDFQYLTQANIAGVVPNELQVWRRGRQVATYLGGNRSVLDISTFLEFYAVHNDGRLDAELYKNSIDQAHPYFSFYTDTASYFLTWSPGTAARHMEEPAVAGGAEHPHRLLNKLDLRINVFNDHPAQDVNYMPWVEPGEGFFMGNSNNANREAVYTIDSVSVSPAGTGPPPRVEVLLFGAPNYSLRSGGVGVPHNVQVIIVPPSGGERVLGLMSFTGLVRARQTFQFQLSDISSAGKVVIKLKSRVPVVVGDYFFVGYLRTFVPQANTWFANRRRLLFENDSLLGGPATYELSGVPTSVVGFDIHDLNNVQRIAGAAGATAGLRRFVFPGANATATHRLLLVDETLLPAPLPARRVRFRAINPAVPTFVIITHPQLMRPAGGVPNAARAYADYRASTAGGRYDTLMVTSQQLYDQFQYGDKSWLALRHFSRWLAAATSVGSQRYLLLLGKGIVPSEPLAGAFFARNGERGFDLVPTSSRSVSDNLITADYAANDFVAKLHTGRLTATTPQQVMNYLNKVKTHDALGIVPWRKNVLHLVGGYNANETAEFRAYLDAGKARIERPLLGGRVTTEFRITPDKLPVSIDISAQLNAGLSLITFFGHGSNNFFALNFGQPSTALNYNNTGRYPFLFLSGCGANHTFTVGATVVEDWLFADQKGALGSLGEYGFSYATQLSIAQDTLYKLLFNDPAWYGKPITAVHDETVRRLQGTPFFNDNIGIEQLLATGWQGDPALALFAPPRPDFIASSATLSVTSTGPAPVRADSPDFILNVGVANPGKITFDPVEIQVTRIFPAGSGLANIVYPLISRRQAWRPDTTYALTLPNAVGVGGTSTLRVVLDPRNQVAELNETNNTAQIDFSFLQGGLTVVNPTEFAISLATQPRLVVQSNDPLGAVRAYDFEIDTVATFTSGVAQRTTLTAGVVAEWIPTLPAALGGRDSLVWYWRARFQTPAVGEDGGWVLSSLRVIPNSPGGWSQSHYTQLQRNTRTGVDVQAPAGRWAFTDTPVPLVLRTRGGGVPRSAPRFGTLTGAGINLQAGGGLQSVSGCGVRSPNLLVAVYSPGSLRPVAMPATFQRCGLAPNNFYYFSVADNSSAFDTLDNLNYSAARQQQLDAFLTAVPAGAYVALVSANRLRYSLLPAALKARLQALLGSQLITRLTDGEPLALLGQKLSATTGRLVHETGPDRSNTTIAGYNQGVEQRDTLQRSGASGRVISTRIGPAVEWLNLYSTVKMLTPSGRYTLSVVAIDTLGRETVVLPNVRTPAQPLTALVAAKRYPYLRLELALADSATRIPPQLRQWLVTSRGLPEGVVRRDSVPALAYAPATLAAQAVSTGFIDFPVKFENVSEVPFAAPLQVRINLRDISQANRPVVATALVPMAAPLPGKTSTLNVHFDVKGKYGTFVTEVVVNPRLQPEQLYSNNELILAPFSVNDNNVPPTLDVAFDGRHILNGELVSPVPVINIQLSDEDKLQPITDRRVFTVTLRKPGQTGPATLVDLNGSDINFSVATTNGITAKLTYEPGKSAPLPDGVYTLEVQGRDPKNASAGAQNFQVKFEVVNASKITNVYPYPNPVISKARFVFTVTGQELPRNMKIQILSLTGRVVREIFMNELGPLHIGNNITDFAWDGTDSFGDRLANGTYLYRVSLDDPNGQFGRRETAGDKAFKNDWGKLVLMR